MTDIKLVNEGGTIVAYDRDTGEQVPVEFDELDVQNTYSESGEFDSLNADVLSTTTVKNALQYDGANGGEMIQAAIDDLGPREGVVFVPPNGPDDGVTTSNGTKDGVWEVTSDIVADDSHTRIEGTMAGAFNDTSGTELVCTDSDVTGVLRLGGDFNQMLQHVYVDAGSNADYCVQVGISGSEQYDHRIWDINAQKSTTAAIASLGTQNLWVTESYIERNEGATGVLLDEAASNTNFWIRDNIIFDCDQAVKFQGGGDLREVWVRGNRINAINQDAFLQANDGTRVLEANFTENRVDGASVSSSGTYDIFRFNGDWSANINNGWHSGGDDANYGINNQGTMLSGGIETPNFTRLVTDDYNNVPSGNIGFDP